MRKQDGFSLIELMIGIAIISLLTAMGTPTFSLWIQNTQNRTAAESILNGLQLARTEAVRHNAGVRFNLTNADGEVSWTVTCAPVTINCPAVNLHESKAGNGGVNARAGIDVETGTLGTALSAGHGLPAGVAFDGLGQVPAANIGADIARIDVTNIVMADARRMVVLVGAGGRIRMCDPALALSTSPQGCQ